MHKPRSRLSLQDRQGFCHVSQLLEILFLKYGIDSSEKHDASGASPSIVGEGILQPAAQTTAEASIARTTAVSNSCLAQTTFAWFQPAELTV